MICVQTILQAGRFSRLFFSLFFYKIIFSGNTRFRHMDRIQNTIKFILVHKLFFQNQTSYRFACLNCLFCNIRSLLISKMGADCSDNTYTVFYQITASFLICRNSYNTIIYQCLDCIAKSIDRLKHAIENNRLKRI